MIGPVYTRPKCPECHGDGRVARLLTNGMEVEEECPMCEGAGEGCSDDPLDDVDDDWIE